MRHILLISLLFCTALVEARMYQWVNPITGSSQLSGKPPTWYRSEKGGPRVLVFDRNKLVDDTAVAVAEEQRLELQRIAFDQPLTEKEKRQQQQEAVANIEQRIKDLVESPDMAAYLTSQGAVDSPADKLVNDVKTNEMGNVSAQADQDTAASKGESQDERVERLKALITAWETNQTESAKSIVESTAVEGETSSEPRSNNENLSETAP